MSVFVLNPRRVRKRIMRMEIYRTPVLHETGSTQGYNCELCYAAGMTAPGPKVRITVDGKVALTVEWAAARFGVKPNSLTGELTRHKDAIQHVAMLDGKKKLYLQRDLDAWWKARRGRDWRAKTDRVGGA